MTAQEIKNPIEIITRREKLSFFQIDVATTFERVVHFAPSHRYVLRAHICVCIIFGEIDTSGAIIHIREKVGRRSYDSRVLKHTRVLV